MIPVWLDCDPGHDDVMAIILAGYSPRLKLLGISTVGCNQTVEKTTINALSTLHATGLDHIARPLIRPLPPLCPEIHGHSGLDGPDGQPLFPRAPKQACSVLSLQAHLYQSFKSHFDATNERVVMICTGSLTNAALLIASHRDIIDCISIVLMGGALGIGNTGPVVEFNIQTDPEAAKIVFESGVPLTMVPLEVTHTALADAAVLNAVLGCSSTDPMDATIPAPGAVRAASAFRAKMVDLLMFFATTYKEVFKFESPPLHDPCAVAYVIAPQLFEVEVMRVDIETVSELSAGQTVCDVWHQSSKPKNAHVAKKMDVEGFWRLMLDALLCADQASPLNR